jgi:hypothetical protein
MSQQPSPFQPPDGDDDMMMDTASPPPANSQQTQSHLEPGPFHHEPVAPNIAGRMPTPIQPHFAAQVRGVWGGPGPALHHPIGVANMGHQHDGFGADDRTIPRTMETADSSWHAVQNRRLPSPISEGEDMCSPIGNGSLSPGMVLDSGFSSHITARLLTREHSVPRDLGLMEMDQDHEDHEDEDITTTTLTLTQTTSAPAEVSSAPATPSPGRKGHIRSRHTVNTWTWQPGMKKSFSIGYRADCEKCRLRVPGHFNHIIVS